MATAATKGGASAPSALLALLIAALIGCAPVIALFAMGGEG